MSGLSVNLAERCKFLKNLLSRKSLDDFHDYGVLLDRSHPEHILCGRMDCMSSMSWRIVSDLYHIHFVTLYMLQDLYEYLLDPIKKESVEIV